MAILDMTLRLSNVKILTWPHFQSMGPRSRPLNERVKEFLHDLDTMDKGPQLHSDSE